MTPDAVCISPELLSPLRIALLGAAGIAVEDLGTLTSDLEGEVVQAEQPDLPSKRAAYHELMAAVRARYELQKAIGLPGDPLRELELAGRAHRELVIEVLTDYRDATVQLQADHEMNEDAGREVAERLLVINRFLRNGHSSGNGRGGHVA
jgi:hypothetical protein